MAIVKFADIVGDASGRIGAVTIARNIHATYVRPYRPSTNPQSLSQNSHRSKYSQISTAWSALSQLQRNAYNTWAADPDNYVTNRLGLEVPLSGWQVFLRQSENRLLASQSLLTAPPSIPRPTAPTLTELQFWIKPGPIYRAVVYFPPNEFLNYYKLATCAVARSQATLALFKNFRFTNWGGKSAATTHNLQPQLVLIIGNWILSTVLHCQLQRLDDQGQTSPSSTITCTCIEHA